METPIYCNYIAHFWGGGGICQPLFLGLCQRGFCHKGFCLWKLCGRDLCPKGSMSRGILWLGILTKYWGYYFTTNRHGQLDYWVDQTEREIMFTWCGVNIQSPITTTCLSFVSTALVIACRWRSKSRLWRFLVSTETLISILNTHVEVTFWTTVIQTGFDRICCTKILLMRKHSLVRVLVTFST